MAKQKILTIEHKDSLVRDDITQEEFDGLQPRIQRMYKVVKERDAAEAPAEVAKPK
jgi:hypothetical protein